MPPIQTLPAVSLNQIPATPQLEKPKKVRFDVPDPSLHFDDIHCSRFDAGGNMQDPLSQDEQEYGFQGLSWAEIILKERSESTSWGVR